eukprot:c25017_g1_i1 orf=575-1144(+)
MTGYWKSKVLPKIKKYFDKGKNKGVSDVCKSFDKSKGSIEKEIEEKHEELKPKVLEIYSSSQEETQKLVKEPTETGVKNRPDLAQNILLELTKIGFPGSRELSDAGTKYGPETLAGPIAFLLLRVSTFVVVPGPPPSTTSRDVAVAPTEEQVVSTEHPREETPESPREETPEVPGEVVPPSDVEESVKI